MVTAGWLMCAGAALTIISTFVFFATTDQYARALAETSGFAAESGFVEREVDEAQAREIFRTVLGVGLWIWMAVKNGQGRKWARVVATILGVINVGLFALSGAILGGIDADLMTDYLLPQMLIGLVSVTLAILILVMLYRPDSTRYYEDSTRFLAAQTLRGYR